MSIWSAFCSWETGTKYLYPMVKTPFISYTHIPGSSRAPIFQPTHENFPRISNYLQGHVAIHHLDAMCSEGRPKGTWQNHVLLRRRTNGPSSPSPEESRNYNRFLRHLYWRCNKQPTETSHQRDRRQQSSVNVFEDVSNVTGIAAADETACYSRTFSLPGPIAFLASSNFIIITGLWFVVCLFLEIISVCFRQLSW